MIHQQHSQAISMYLFPATVSEYSSVHYVQKESWIFSGNARVRIMSETKLFSAINWFVTVNLEKFLDVIVNVDVGIQIKHPELLLLPALQIIPAVYTPSVR